MKNVCERHGDTIVVYESNEHCPLCESEDKIVGLKDRNDSLDSSLLDAHDELERMSKERDEEKSESDEIITEKDEVIDDLRNEIEELEVKLRDIEERIHPL